MIHSNHLIPVQKISLLIATGLFAATLSSGAQSFAYDFQEATVAPSNVFDNTGWDSTFNSNSTNPNSRFNQQDRHGIYDSPGQETAGAVIIGLTEGRNTGVYNAAGLNYTLANQGDTATFRVANEHGPFRDRPQPLQAVNEMVQIGFISDLNGTFGDGSDAIYIGALQTSHDWVNQTYTTDLGLFSGDGQVTFGGSSLNFATGLELDFFVDGRRTWYEYEVTFSNNGLNALDIDVDIDQWAAVGFNNNPDYYEEIDTDFFSGSLTDVSLKSFGDLGQIAPGLGTSIQDRTTISNTGATYDYFVPEPSSSFLIVLTLPALLLRKRQ